MFTRHAASRRAVNSFRPNLLASAVVRPFSSGSRCAEASQQQSDSQTLIRRYPSKPSKNNQSRSDTQTLNAKVSDKAENVADPRSGNTSSTPRRRKDDTLTDSEYRRWIEYPYKYATCATLCGISLKPYDYKDIEARVPEHLRQEPLKFTDDSDVLDPSLAGDCMRLYLYRLMDRTIRRERPSDDLWEQPFDASAFRACLINDNAGAKALSWLLNTANHESIESTFGSRFIQATAFCLVGERRTDLWWDMLKIQHAPKPTKDTAMLGQRYHSIRWSGTWVTAILEAQAFWTTERNRLNEPLATLLEVLRLNRRERTGGAPIPTLHAMQWFRTKLPIYDTRHIDAEAWDAFAEYQLKFRRNEPQETLFRQALLQFVHPVNRRADPLLAWLRHSESDESEMQILIRMAKYFLQRIMLRLTQYCYNNGRMTDVRWTIGLFHRIRRERNKLDLGELLDPHGWVPRPVGRKATPKEIAEGLPVDAQGRLIPITFKGTAEDVRKQYESASKVHRQSP